MKLIYISPLRYPSDRAGSIFSIKSCEAFSDQNIDVELWIPWRHSISSDTDLFGYFGVRKNFKIRRFLTVDLTKFFSGAYFLLYYSFAFSIFFYSLGLKLSKKIQHYTFYSHEQFALFLLTLVSKKTFYEMHDFPGRQWLYSIFFKRINGVVTTNKWKSERLLERFHLAQSKVYIAQNAVDVENFSHVPEKLEARKILGFFEEDYLFGYIGTLKTMGMDKGFSTAILALQFLPENFKLCVVGADSADDLEYYKSFAEDHGVLAKIIFVGQVPHSKVPIYTSACDALIAPFPKNDHYSYYMSPMKIFEYMASKRPIIATDLPSIREVLLDEEMAIFTPPGESEALAKAIMRLAGDSDLSYKLAERAYAEVSTKHTWSKRAKKILSFIS